MASANASATLRWKRAKIHRGSRRRSFKPHKEAGYTSEVVTRGPELPNPLAIGRGPYTSRHDNAVRGYVHEAVIGPHAWDRGLREPKSASQSRIAIAKAQSSSLSSANRSSMSRELRVNRIWSQ